MIRIVLVTNTPPPYRIPIFSRLAAWPGIEFRVLFCARREPNRHWNLPPLNFAHDFLRERFVTVNGRYIHHNPDIIGLLWKLAPDVVITDGFNPTHLYAFMTAMARRCAHVAMTDGTELSERTLSRLHRLVRRLVYAKSKAFISASIGGDRLYQSYGIRSADCFHSWLCIDNARFAPRHCLTEAEHKRFDFIFCARLEPEKDPLFALEVARQTAQIMQKKLRLLFVGSGSLETALREAAAREQTWLDVQCYGFASQQALPGLYRSARLFLFPTHADVWGIVANEACAAGLPVLVTPHAGVAGELVIDGENGYVRERDVAQWCACAQRLLSDSALYQSFSQTSVQHAARYQFDSAAEGLVNACLHAVSQHPRSANISDGQSHSLR